MGAIPERLSPTPDEPVTRAFWCSTTPRTRAVEQGLLSSIHASRNIRTPVRHLCRNEARNARSGNEFDIEVKVP